MIPLYTLVDTPCDPPVPKRDYIDTDVYVIDSCMYVHDNYDSFLSNVVNMNHDSLDFDGYHIKYEYILTFEKFYIKNTLVLTTITAIDSTVSFICLKFDSVQDMIQFEIRMLGKILFYKDSGKYDRHVFNFARKFLSIKK